MDSIAIAYPVQPGKIQDVHRLADHTKSGTAHEHGQKLHARRQELGIRSIKVYLQRNPQEMLIVVLEGNNIQEAMKKHLQAETEAERWFQQTIQEITGVHPRIHADAQPDLISEWHA